MPASSGRPDVRSRVSRTAVAALLGALLAVLLPALVAAPAQAADNGSWSIFPTQKKGADPRSAFLFELAAGQQVSDSVTIKNQSDGPLTLHLYPADAFNAAGGGGFALRQQDEENTGVGSWVTVSKSEVRLRSGQEVDVPFTMTVPSNATPGDHAGGIVALNAEVDGTQEADGGVTVGIRRAVGTRIYTRVQGPLNPSLTITSLTAEMTDKGQVPFVTTGTATVTYTILNSGNLRISADQALRVTGLFGREVAAPELAGAPEILPGQQITLVQQVTGLPTLDVLSFRLDLTSPEASAGADTTVWVIPWLFVIGLLVLILVILAIRWWLRRRADRTPTAAPSNSPFPTLAAPAGSAAPNTSGRATRAHGRS